MPEKNKGSGFREFELWLGTFSKGNGEFEWKVVDKFDDFDEAHSAYKKYVDKQLGYTDEELIKVWGSGRLDIELRTGTKLLNWTGVYIRETSEREQEKLEGKEKDDDSKKSESKDSITDVCDESALNVAGRDPVIMRLNKEIATAQRLGKQAKAHDLIITRSRLLREKLNEKALKEEKLDS